MSGQYVKVLVPEAVDAPRGALWAAAALVWVLRVLFARQATVQP